MGNQLPEFLPMEMRESISDLISHARHMLGSKGKATCIMGRHQQQTAKQLH